MFKKSAKAKGVTNVGVVSEMSADNSVAKFDTWSDIKRGTLDALKKHKTYSGVPMTQGQLDKHYPGLKRNTTITKKKLSSKTVKFLDFENVFVVECGAHVYIVAPLFEGDITKKKPAPKKKKTVVKEKPTKPKRKAKPKCTVVHVKGYTRKCPAKRKK